MSDSPIHDCRALIESLLDALRPLHPADDLARLLASLLVAELCAAHGHAGAATRLRRLAAAVEAQA